MAWPVSVIVRNCFVCGSGCADCTTRVIFTSRMYDAGTGVGGAVLSKPYEKTGTWFITLYKYGTRSLFVEVAGSPPFALEVTPRISVPFCSEYRIHWTPLPVSASTMRSLFPGTTQFPPIPNVQGVPG